MDHRDNENADVTKVAQAQQPQAEHPQPPESLQTGQPSKQASDVEESSGSFLGTQASSDTSSELIEDDDNDFARDGQGAPE